MTILPGFTPARTQVNGQTIAFARAGSGPPLLLLHGYPQTHAMWHGIAPQLAQNFTVIAADLRGYGLSSKPATVADMGFRPMAADQVALMQSLGFERFHVAGHDRGARTAHRMALDAPDALLSLTLMDIVPTQHLLTNLTHETARGYYHWFFLAQKAPAPERMIAADPLAFYRGCLTGFGGDDLTGFAPEALKAYETAWQDPETTRTMCNDYRAAINHDLALDTADMDRQVKTPSLVLYGASGLMGRAFDVPATWQTRLANMQSRPMPGGHFFPDTHPEETTQALLDFLSQL